MSNHIHPPRDNGGIIMGVKSPAWFREWFGDYDTSKFDANGTCAHCGKHGGRYGAGALSGECYLGLCADCWTSLLWHCLEVVNRQIDRHPEKWKGSERPDGLQLALYKIRRNIQLGTFDLLCKVAIDGVPNTELKEAQKAAVLREKRREYNRRYYHKHKEKIRARASEFQRKWYQANKEKCLERMREYQRTHAKELREYQRRYRARRTQRQ